MNNKLHSVNNLNNNGVLKNGKRKPKRIPVPPPSSPAASSISINLSNDKLNSHVKWAHQSKLNLFNAYDYNDDYDDGGFNENSPINNQNRITIDTPPPVSFYNFNCGNDNDESDYCASTKMKFVIHHYHWIDFILSTLFLYFMV